MSEKYLGAEHYFTQKFKKRKGMVGNVQEAQAYAPEAETPEAEDYLYYQSLGQYQEAFVPVQAEGTKYQQTIRGRGRCKSEEIFEDN